MDEKFIEKLDLLVSDQQQIVSYKWLSRNFCVTSNAAKRLLEDYVRHSKEKEAPLEVLYTVSGWNNDTPSTYLIHLAPSSKLSAAIKKIGDLASVQVYSVQRKLPSDLSQVWNSEFIQTDALYRQPIEANNSLRDNRYSAVECTSISRILTNNSVPHQQPEAKVAPPREQPPKAPEITREQPESKIDKEETSEIPEKRKIPGNNSSKGQSLSNMWQKASSRQPEKPRVNASKAVMIATADDAIKELEDSESESDNDAAQFASLRTGVMPRSSKYRNKRRPVMILDDDDDEDESDMAVDLSADPMNEQVADDHQDLVQVASIEADGINPGVESMAAIPLLQEEAEASKTGVTVLNVDLPPVVPSSAVSAKGPPSVSRQSVKRQKRIVTTVDARGKEVTRIEWVEEEGSGKQQEEKECPVKVPNEATKKDPAVPPSKGKSQKTGANIKKPVPQKGNIMAFFKSK